MAKRRKLRGKRLLVAAGIAGASMVGCEDETVANLVAPPPMDAEVRQDGSAADAAEPMDGSDFFDAPVANLLPPPDSGPGPTDSGPTDSGPTDSGPTDGTMDADVGERDGGEGSDAGGDDAGEPSDARVFGYPDAPVANLLPPPDGSF